MSNSDSVAVAPGHLLLHRIRGACSCRLVLRLGHEGFEWTNDHQGFRACTKDVLVRFLRIIRNPDF